jgi:hypothetical protein
MSNKSKQTSKPKPSDNEMNYKLLFKTPLGLGVLEDLKKVLGHGKTVYLPGRKDSDNAFEQGRQSVINDILYILNK